MQPAELTASSFAGYPPEARKLAAAELSLLRQLPLALVPILLRELIAYDWKLPAERRELDRQLGYLSGLTLPQLASSMADFRTLPLTPALAALDWVNDPSGFMEQLTAWLWSTHRMDGFRATSQTYSAAVDASAPPDEPSMPRLGLVVIGGGAGASRRPLFRKLRASGVHFSAIEPEGALEVLVAQASRRALEDLAGSKTQNPRLPGESNFKHWYIDGGLGARQSAGLTQVSYAELEQPRTMLLERIQQAIATNGMGPERLRSLLARMKPEDVGFSGAGSDAVLNHFQLSLMTEGSGTQIFATTFVQWAARECARRAQPETLLVRFAPRRKAETMNAMLSGSAPNGTDPEGSLIDADLGAYYTWLNMRRLSGRESLRYLVWLEGSREALAIGPGLPGGTSSDSKLHMNELVKLLA